MKKRFITVSAIVSLLAVTALSTPASANPCTSYMGFPGGKTYCCTFKSEHGTLTGKNQVFTEIGAVAGADFNLTGPFTGSGLGPLTDIGCSCQAKGTVTTPVYDVSPSFICGGPDNGAVGDQNHTAIVGTAAAHTLTGQILHEANGGTVSQIYDAVIYTCTDNPTAVASCF
jgi:hypothetical protein